MSVASTYIGRVSQASCQAANAMQLGHGLNGATLGKERVALHINDNERGPVYRQRHASWPSFVPFDTTYIHSVTYSQMISWTRYFSYVPAIFSTAAIHSTELKLSAHKVKAIHFQFYFILRPKRKCVAAMFTGEEPSCYIQRKSLILWVTNKYCTSREISTSLISLLLCVVGREPSQLNIEWRNKVTPR